MQHENRGSLKAKNTIFFFLSLVVFVVPVFFFSELLSEIKNSLKDTELVFMREEIEHKVENVNTVLDPGNYFEMIVGKVSNDLWGDLEQKISFLEPEPDFGSEYFNSNTALNIKNEMKNYGVDSLMVIVAKPGFSDLHYWASDKLLEQCKEPERLAKAFVTQQIEQFFIKTVNGQGTDNLSYEAIEHITSDFKRFEEKNYIFNKYISRVSRMHTHHDKRVNAFYTDYFGRQIVFTYSSTLSNTKGVYGSYVIIALQDEINPADMISAALKAQPSAVSAKINHSKSPVNRFKETDKGIKHSTSIPAVFQNHCKLFEGKYDATSIQFDYFRPFPNHFQQFLNHKQVFSFLVSITALMGIAFVLKLLIKGFEINYKIKTKLIIVTASIFIIPLTAVYIMIYSIKSGFTNYQQKLVLAQVNNRLELLRLAENENYFKHQACVMEIKRILQLNSTQDMLHNINLIKSNHSLPWLHDWFLRIKYYDSNNNNVNIRLAELQKPDEIWEALFRKYLYNIRVIPDSEIDGGLLMVISILEDALIPEVEEIRMPRESTSLIDIQHISVIDKAYFSLIKAAEDLTIALYFKLTSREKNMFFLDILSIYSPEMFSINNEYANTVLGIRKREVNNYLRDLWPQNHYNFSLLDYNFSQGLKRRSSGNVLTREKESIEAKFWNFDTFSNLVLGATTKINKDNSISLLLDILMPSILIYSIILIIVLANLNSKLILAPLLIFKNAITQIKNQNYGFKIISFSQDEFNDLTIAFNQMSQALRQRHLMQRYVSDKLISDMSRGISAEKLQVTVLASDIRSFTTITEKYSPEEVVEMLNEYFTAMEEAITNEGGTIDKFVGDAINAVFYNDSSKSSAAERACKAATKMLNKLQHLNTKRENEKKFTIKNGIGIATGEVISGSIGGLKGRKDHTIIGSVTNLAASIESETANLSPPILVCEKTMLIAKTLTFGRLENNRWQLKP